MDTEESSQLRPKSSRAPPLSPESECFVHLLVLVFLIDGGGLEQVWTGEKEERRRRKGEGEVEGREGASCTRCAFCCDFRPRTVLRR